MRALHIDGYGEPLQGTQTALPTPKPGQVLVENRFTSFNQIDPGRASGAMKQMFPLTFPWIPGGDVAGRVAAVGEAEETFAIGDEVFGYNFAGGAYAEFALVDTSSLAKRSTALLPEHAAAVASVGQTAQQCLALAGLQKGQALLVIGGAGGVGSLAIQLAAKAGIRVSATASAGKQSTLTTLGAQSVFEYSPEGLQKHQQVDAVLNLVGGATVAASYEAVKQGGIAITSNQPPDAEEAARLGIRTAFVQLASTTAGLESLAQLITTGELKPQIAQIESLWTASTVWQNRQTSGVGKIVFAI